MLCEFMTIRSTVKNRAGQILDLSALPGKIWRCGQLQSQNLKSWLAAPRPLAQRGAQAL